MAATRYGIEIAIVDTDALLVTIRREFKRLHDRIVWAFWCGLVVGGVLGIFIHAAVR